MAAKRIKSELVADFGRSSLLYHPDKADRRLQDFVCNNYNSNGITLNFATPSRFIKIILNCVKTLKGSTQNSLWGTRARAMKLSRLNFITT